MTSLLILICTWRRAALRVQLRVRLHISEAHHPNGLLPTKAGAVSQLRPPRCRPQSMQTVLELIKPIARSFQSPIATV